MLDALELLHYVERFRDSRFLIVLDPECCFQDIAMDLRLLQASHIHAIVLCAASETTRSQSLRTTERGSKFYYFDGRGSPTEFVEHALEKRGIPIIGLPECPCLTEFLQENGVFQLADTLGVRKIFLLSSTEGLEIDSRFRSYPTAEEIKSWLEQDVQVNIPRDLLALLFRRLQRSSSETILLRSEPGTLFQEIFTHRGRGTLFTLNYPNIIRQGTLEDTHTLSLLMKPAIEEQALLPLTEDEIATEIHRYSLYTVNGEVVAAAKLTDYGSAAELGKFTTLPRYQGRGRARELARHLLVQAQEAGYQYVFALSTRPKMWDFFQGLGFTEGPREKLPEAWARNYNFNRPSRAFMFRFSVHSAQ